MNMESLRFRAISHMPEGQLVEFLAAYNASAAQNPQRYSANINQASDKNTELKRSHGPAGFETSREIIRNQAPMKDSIIESFTGNGRNV